MKPNTTTKSYLPQAIGVTKEGSFGRYTVMHRLPKIVADAVVQFGDRERRDPRWNALTKAICEGALIEHSLFEANTPFWKEKIRAIAGMRWTSLPFFDLEFLFYHALNSITADLKPGFDIFARQRHAALIAALPRLVQMLEKGPSYSVLDACLLAVSGNEADLSQFAIAENSSKTRMVVDERDRLMTNISMYGGDGRFHIVLDNAGLELCLDLVLVDSLLSARSGPIVLHAKSRPMFVSDALITDVVSSIGAFRDLSPLAKLGGRLTAAFKEGRLLVEASEDWAEPRHMNALGPELEATLRSADLIVVKGDLNYRRFFEDRDWPIETPVATASVASAMRAFAFRVLKSEVVVGVAGRERAKLSAADAYWRTNGRYSLIQRVDTGEWHEGPGHW